VEANARTTLSEFQTEASSNDASASKPASRIRIDFEGLLELAERLQQSYEEQTSKRQSAFIMSQVYGLFFILEFLAVYVSVSFLFLNRINPISSHLNYTAYLFCISSVVIAVAIGIITFFYFNNLRQRLQQIKRHMKTDERDLTEVVELLREIEPAYAKEEQLSALERVQIRIRLSRFGIGSSSRGKAEDTARELKEEFQSRKSRVDQELMKPS